jgi:hypothetical protein
MLLLSRAHAYLVDAFVALADELLLFFPSFFCMPPNGRLCLQKGKEQMAEGRLNGEAYPPPGLEQESEARRRRNPLVLVGSAATAGVLAAGLIAFRRGNTRVSQQMMRARILAQASTVAIMTASSGAMLSSSSR